MCFYETVDVKDMAQARERRAFNQALLLQKHGQTLVSFCLNIAGPLKATPLYKKAFLRGLSKIEAILSSLHYLESARILMEEKTGFEALLAINGDAFLLKRLFCALEQNDGIGRLYDIDVIDKEGNKLSRNAPRPCLVCQKEDGVCAASRAHPLSEIIEKTDAMIVNTLQEDCAERLSLLAEKALLYELAVSPKPGLVDRFNSGAHSDMDFFSFLDSALVLRPFFKNCALFALRTEDKNPENLFLFLQQNGMLAEMDMRLATHGVNTHKGAIFSLSLALGAAAYTKSQDPGTICQNIQSLFSAYIAPSLQSSPNTNGLKLFQKSGVKGARGQAMNGYRIITERLLPKLKAMLAAGKSINDAALSTLLLCISLLDDTNLLKRAGEEGAKCFQKRAGSLVDGNPASLFAFDEEAIQNGISPGGSADMLALCLFFYFLEQEGDLYP